jgi:hypothetical protein
MNLSQRCQALNGIYRTRLCQYKLSKLLKSFGYGYTKAKREIRCGHANKLQAQVLWTKTLVYYKDIMQLPIYYIDESSVNLWHTSK